MGPTVYWLAAACVPAVCLGAWLYYQTTFVGVTELQAGSERLPNGFDGVRIVHLSDLQNSRYGNRFYRRIVRLCKECRPDYIVFTGDIIDRRKYNLKNAEQFVGQLTESLRGVPFYYVTGNHEAWCGRYGEVRQMLERFGVTVLDDRAQLLARGGDTVRLIGVDDPGFISRQTLCGDALDGYADKLRSLSGGEYQILLTHRPELIDVYAACGVDLVLCGHAHGGQYRLPLIGALYAPHQGLFPKLCRGVHRRGNTEMIISRGLGSGKMQVRTFNRPEIVAVTLQKRES